MAIILFILKLIGILLLILLLGIVLLLVLPICYKAEASFHGKDVKAKGKVTWALLFLRVNVRYEEELYFMVRLFGIPCVCSDEKRWTLFGGGDDVVKVKKAKKPKKDKKPKEESVSMEKAQDVSPPVETPQIKDNNQDILDMDFDDDRWDDDSTKEEKKVKGESKFLKVKGFILRILEGIKSVYGKIKNLMEKGQSIVALLEDEDIIAALLRLKGYGMEGTKALLPQKIKGDLTFGFDDPALTGKILGHAAVLYGFYGENFNLYPDFTKQTIQGNLLVKGRLRRYRLIRLMWRIWRDKDLMRQKDRMAEVIGG